MTNVIGAINPCQSTLQNPGMGSTVGTSTRRQGHTVDGATPDMDGDEPPSNGNANGEPEPLQFLVNPGLRLMLIPRGGFGWVIGEHEVAVRGTVEMVLSREARSEAAVRELADVAASSGGSVVTAAGHRPWGYAALVADPDGHVWQVIAAEGDLGSSDRAGDAP